MNIQTQPPVVSGRPQPGSPKSAFIADVVRKCMEATPPDHPDYAQIQARLQRNALRRDISNFTK